jgi:hypothetical protein
VQRGYKKDDWGLSSAREAEKKWRYNLVMRYSPERKDVSTEAEESPLLTAVTGEDTASWRRLSVW